MDYLIPIPQSEFLQRKEQQREVFEITYNQYTTRNYSNYAKSLLIERVADYLASTAGFVVGYTGGFAIGVYTRANPLATGYWGGVALGATFPWLIKEIVT